jgi:hypothetical protein
MFPTNEIMQRSMQLARRMVGTNEFALGEEAALRVLVQHGGSLDQDGAPVYGPCVRCNSTISQQPCDTAQLAWSVLLLYSTFKTSHQSIVDDVLTRIGAEVQRGSRPA